MDSEEYEIMPHKELMNLKTELKKLRTKGGRMSTSKADLESMDTLNNSIQELVSVFKTAAKEMKTEENEEAQILHKLTDAIEMMNTIVDQNEKIAEGIVTVAEMIKDHMPKGDSKPAPHPPLGTFDGVPVLGTQKPPATPHAMPASLPRQQPPAQPPSMAPQSSPPPGMNPPVSPPAMPPSGPPPGMNPPASPPGLPPSGPPGMNPSGGPPPPGSPFPDMPKPESQSMDAMPPPPAPPPPPSAPATPPPAEKGGLLSRFK
jgi:hypothetical protein